MHFLPFWGSQACWDTRYFSTFIVSAVHNRGVCEKLLPNKRKQKAFPSYIIYCCPCSWGELATIGSYSCSWSSRWSYTSQFTLVQWVSVDFGLAVCISDISVITACASELCLQKWGAGVAATSRRAVLLAALGPQETLFPFLALPQTPGLLEGKSYKVNLSRAQFSLVTEVEWIFESAQQHLMSVVCWSLVIIFIYWEGANWELRLP